MKINSLFITATGTDIGKTYVSALIVKKIREIGLNCGYFKPVLSGATKDLNGKLNLGDPEFVIKTAGLNCSANDCVSYCFEDPVSPHLAALRVGCDIEIEKIVSDYNKLLEVYDFIVVEGAGGITCPLNISSDKLLLPDVIKAVGGNIIIVADSGLGTINSSFLTAEFAKNQGFNILGFILNNYDENNFMHVDNKMQIENLTGLKVFATVKQGQTDFGKSDDILKFILGEEL
ncbi:MAG: dethiobiotin synthase [Cyanobacteria bacterium SIG26]|nr:dethiobiotin synthase [Cyanobacteria bacterium SIG26]